MELNWKSHSYKGSPEFKISESNPPTLTINNTETGDNGSWITYIDIDHDVEKYIVTGVATLGIIKFLLYKKRGDERPAQSHTIINGEDFEYIPNNKEVNVIRLDYRNKTKGLGEAEIEIFINESEEDDPEDPPDDGTDNPPDDGTDNPPENWPPMPWPTPNPVPTRLPATGYRWGANMFTRIHLPEDEQSPPYFEEPWEVQGYWEVETNRMVLEATQPHYADIKPSTDDGTPQEAPEYDPENDPIDEEEQ